MYHECSNQNFWEYDNITVLVYFAWGLGLTNHIIQNVIASVFHHIPRGRRGEENRSQNNLK